MAKKFNPEIERQAQVLRIELLQVNTVQTELYDQYRDHTDAQVVELVDTMVPLLENALSVCNHVVNVLSTKEKE